MNKTEAFKRAINNLSDYANAAYMSEIKNWCVVHATKYMPQKHTDGTLFIPSTGMADNFKAPRSTVHTTFNHIVKSHGYGSWDNMPIVILVPYNDVVKNNGNPAEIAITDTYWSVNPDRGFVLPDSAYIVKPSNEVLFNIGENGATYKRDNYSDEEIKNILDLMKPKDRDKFNRYQSGDLDDYEIEEMLGGDERIKKMFEASKDKRAFLRGMAEEVRFDMLAHYLRDIVVRMSMDKIGYRELQDTYENSNASKAVVKTAVDMGIPATASNKGHSQSFYSRIEDLFDLVSRIKAKMSNTADLQSLSDYIKKQSQNKNQTTVVNAIMQSIITNKPLDFMALYENVFAKSVQDRLLDINSVIEYFINKYKTTDDKNEQTELVQTITTLQKDAQNTSGIKKISDYDKNLFLTVQKHALRLSVEYEACRKGLSAKDGYDNFIKDLKKQYVETKNIDKFMAVRDRN